MWENWGPHEWARLPMLCAIGWALTGDGHWRDMYRRYAWDAYPDWHGSTRCSNGSETLRPFDGLDGDALVASEVAQDLDYVHRRIPERGQ